jgi:hypothetical protein
VIKPDSSKLKEMFDTPKAIKQITPMQQNREHRRIPRMPRRTRRGILPPINERRNESWSFAQACLRFSNPRLQKRQPLLVRPRLLPRLLPFPRVMMHEQRAMILLDLDRGCGRRAGIFE